MKIANLFSKMKNNEEKNIGMELPQIILLSEKEKEEYLNKLTKALHSYLEGLKDYFLRSFSSFIRTQDSHLEDLKGYSSVREFLAFQYFLTKNIEALKSNFKLFTPLEVNGVSGLPTITMFSILEGIKDNLEECEKVLSSKLEKMLEEELEKSLKSDDNLTNWIQTREWTKWLEELKENHKDPTYLLIRYRNLVSEVLLNKILYFNKEMHKKFKNLVIPVFI